MAVISDVGISMARLDIQRALDEVRRLEAKLEKNPADSGHPPAFFTPSQMDAEQAAIDRAKALSGVQDDSAALEVICWHFTDRTIAITPDFLAATVGNFLKEDATGEFREKILASLTPYLESQAD
jgi:hypothetical protein